MYRDELRLLRSQIDEKLPDGAPTFDQPSEREHWERLQARLVAYWDSLDFVFEPLPFDTVMATTILRSEVLPARMDVVQVLDEMKELQRVSQEEHDRQVAVLYADVRSRLLWVVAGALVMGIGIAWFAFWHVGAARAGRCTGSGWRRPERGTSWSGCRRGWSRRRNRSGARSRASCTTKSARR